MATPTLATVGGLEFSTGYPGQLAETLFDPQIESRNNENATAIDYGDATCRGVATVPGTIGNCKPPVSGGVVLGLVVRALSEANTAVASGLVNYPQSKTVPILKDGMMWCLAAEGVTEGDTGVVVVGTTGVGGSTVGAANGTTRLAIPGAIWQQTVTIGNVGLVRIKTA